MEAPLKDLSTFHSSVSEVNQDLEASHHGFFQNDSIKSLSWNDIGVSIRSRKADGCKPILQACSGLVQSGQVLALIGPSGSGKSTMLNVLASRTKLSYTGSVYVNGSTIAGASMQDVSAFVQQEDKNLGGLTVAESIKFTSRLANPTVSNQQRTWLNEEVIKALGLDAQRDTIISSPFRNNLSGGQKRRLSLATALVTGPKILFLDEPTSGLDSAASHEVMTFITRFAKQFGIIVVASIHQPSSSTLGLFNLVMLISAGRTCFFGPEAELVSYFSASCAIPQYCNPAEFLLELVNTDFCQDDSKERQVSLFVTSWTCSQQNRALTHHIVTTQERFRPTKPSRASNIQACFILLHRNLIKSYRDPLVYGSRVAINIALALVIGRNSSPKEPENTLLTTSSSQARFGYVCLTLKRLYSLLSIACSSAQLSWLLWL
jgi:ABC-type multidrug transport system ATPase subunit